MLIDSDNIEEFYDPPNYDLEEGPGKAPRVAFYAALAQETGGPVLDLACGSGLATIPLAELGLDVTGVDLSPVMLGHARYKSRHLPIQWYQQDVRALDLDRQFRFILITGNAFQAMLTRTDQETFLAGVVRHLLPDGRFAFETRNPRPADLITTTEEEPWHRYTSVEGYDVTVSGTQRWVPHTQIMHWTTYRRWWHNGEQVQKVTRIATRFTAAEDLWALLHASGLELVARYGSWDRRPLTSDSPSIISVCRKRSTPEPASNGPP